jgi:hypothetical protein
VHYMFLIYLDESASASRSDAEIKAGMAAHTPYIEMLRRNGQYAASDALGPASSALTLRSAGGKPIATQGPFAESREQLGGYYVVAAKDLDEAITAAAQCPALQTVGVGIEIRPIRSPVAAEPGGPGRYLLAIYRDETLEDAADGDVGRLAFTKLSPSGSATTLRLRDGHVVLTDGPFMERREQLAGYCVVPARDMEEAAALASGCAAARAHAIEVRSIRTR